MRQLLKSGEFPAGAQFLTERQVAERFGVSRITANKALASLASERLLEFRKGVGTFVSPVTYDYNLRSLVSFTEMVESQGGRAETRVLRFEPDVEAPAQLAALDAVAFVERLRLANGLPVILERRWFGSRQCPGLVRRDLEGSIYGLWTGRFALAIAGAEQVIRAVRIEGEAARLLEVEPGAAGLLNRSTGSLESGEPLWFEETLYRGDAYEFFNRLGHIEKPQPALGRLIG
jgi:GntR family transcriptional regulator